MPGTMSQADLVADLKASLQDAADIFTAAADADFIRHLGLAALDMSRLRPRTMLGTLAAVADKYDYPAPADLLSYKSDLWGAYKKNCQPWEKNNPGRLPEVRLVVNGLIRELHMIPPPSAHQIAILGSAYKYYYFAAHSIGVAAADTTVQPGDRGLLLIRAQAEAMKEMAMRNIKKPVQLRDGLSNGPRNGTPSYLFEVLMKQFEEMA